MARRILHRAHVLTAAAMIGGAALALLPVASASAEVFYDEGGCVVQQITDGAPAGGSQCAGVDFNGTSMGQAALMGANVSGADFSGSKLQAANFTGANIEGANFTNSQVEGADFTNTGILPETISVEATDQNGAAITFSPVVPEGLTATDCLIVDTPVVSGTVFPIGDSGMLCHFTSSNGTAFAVVKIQVTAAAAVETAAPPLFTDSPTTASTASSRPPLNWGLIGGIAGGAVLVLGLGIAAMVISRRSAVPATEPAGPSAERSGLSAERSGRSRGSEDRRDPEDGDSFKKLGF